MIEVQGSWFPLGSPEPELIIVTLFGKPVGVGRCVSGRAKELVPISRSARPVRSVGPDMVPTQYRHHSRLGSALGAAAGPTLIVACRLSRGRCSSLLYRSPRLVYL